MFCGYLEILFLRDTVKLLQPGLPHIACRTAQHAADGQPCDGPFFPVKSVTRGPTCDHACATEHGHTIIFADVIDRRFETLHLLRAAANGSNQYTAEGRKTKRFIHSYSLPFLFNAEMQACKKCAEKVISQYAVK
ncbi:hypothetical protein D3C81_1772070 [compost metagenome]